jgi:small-conductance mechanosensitive channel
MGHIELEVKDWVLALSILAAAVISGLAIQLAVFAALKRIAKKTDSIVDDALVRRGRRPARVLVPLVAVLMALPFLAIPEELVAMVRHGVILGLIAAAAWLVISLTAVFDDVVFSKFQIDTKDNLAARQVRTKTYVLRRIIVIVITVFSLSVMLMTFPAIRNVGVSLFASAGVAGLVIGMAARPMLSNIIAGIQIALTQPIRIDDVVIVEGEWGRIEEITLTYVIVHIWDDRRLVLPLSYFIEKPFQNWTRVSADLLGSVFVWADYTLPIAELRPAIQHIVEGCRDWDRRFWNLQVTDTTDRAMQLRVLATAADASKAWDLRCEIREKLLGYLQEHHRQGLPKVRASLDTGLAGSPGASPGAKG